jgi:DNA-binding transcriptional LysR family regulator
MKFLDIHYAKRSYCNGNGPSCRILLHSDASEELKAGAADMNLIDLEAFISVVDHGSIVAAAAALHLTQSAVTRRVQNLEDALGVPLLDRQTRPLQPTLAGTETYEFARPVLSSVGDLKAAIMHNEEPSGDFRFGMPRGFGDLAVASPIRCLRAEFPKLKLHAFVQWTGALLERLANRRLDAAIVILREGATPPTSFIAECLGTIPIHVVAARTKHFSQPLTLEELSSNQWILNPHGCATRQILEDVLLQQGLPLESTVEAEGYELQFSLIADGVGLGLTMPGALHASAFRKGIKTLKIKDIQPQQSIWLVHSRHIGRMKSAVHCLRDAVQKSLRSRAS